MYIRKLNSPTNTADRQQLNDRPTGALYERRLGKRTLTIQAEGSRLVDRETQSTWDAASGRAVQGPLKGETLKPLEGFLSFRETWKTFHPKSEITPIVPAKP